MKKSAVTPPPPLVGRYRQIASSAAVVLIPLLLIFVLLIAFMVRVMIGWSALRDHGQVVDATVSSTSSPYRRGVRGSAAAANVYNYSFEYRGVRYDGVSAFDVSYLGEWPHMPYRVTFLPESPEVNDILPVGRWYVLQKSAEPGFLLLIFAAMLILPFTIADEKKETRSGIVVRLPAKKGKDKQAVNRQPSRSAVRPPK